MAATAKSKSANPAKAARDLKPVDAGHHHIEHQEIGRTFAEAPQRARAIGNNVDVIRVD